jgi:hypothetical protein
MFLVYEILSAINKCCFYEIIEWRHSMSSSVTDVVKTNFVMHKFSCCSSHFGLWNIYFLYQTGRTPEKVNIKFDFHGGLARLRDLKFLLNCRKKNQPDWKRFQTSIKKSSKNIPSFPLFI